MSSSPMRSSTGSMRSSPRARTSTRPTAAGRTRRWSRRRDGAEELPMSLAPSGRQFEISRGEQRATVVEVGGGIREYAVGDRDVLEPYPLEAMCDGAHGAPLIPRPNRVADGRYSFGGSDLQLALPEPPRRNAIHGLMRWRPWEALEQGLDRVTLRARLLPMSGFPFHLDLPITY